MTLTLVPWAVDAAKHPARLARIANYAATSAAEGVIGGADLMVRATPTPSPQVRVAPGAVAIRNRFPGAGQQTYIGQVVSEHLVDVPASGSAGARTHYVCAIIRDPEFPGTPMLEDPKADDAQFFFIEVLSSIPAGQSVYPLAKIVVPANTAAITDEMITDLRNIAQPQEKSFMYSNPTIVATEETLTSTLTKGELFPNVGSITAPIPEWATRVQIEAEWLQVVQPAGDFNGRIWVEWGPYIEQSVRTYKTQAFAVNGNGSNNVDRSSWKVAQEMVVPVGMRGTQQIFFMKGRLLSSSNSAARPRLDSASGLVLKLRFLEVPDDFRINA